jgi:hypothetical protein
MRLLGRQGLVILHGRGCGAYYAPGPKLAAQKKGGSKGRK